MLSEEFEVIYDCEQKNISFNLNMTDSRNCAFKQHVVRLYNVLDIQVQIKMAFALKKFMALWTTAIHLNNRNMNPKELLENNPPSSWLTINFKVKKKKSPKFWLLGLIQKVLSIFVELMSCKIPDIFLTF